jgi:hypothetical protein
MKIDEHTKLYENCLGSCSGFLSRLMALPLGGMVGGDDEEEAPSTMLAQAAVLIARGEPICIGLYDHNPILIADPPMMGYYHGQDPSDLEASIDWLEELSSFLDCMASNLRVTQARMESQTEEPP